MSAIEWHVEYRIEVEAESAEDAADIVRDILATGGAERGAYHVRPHVAEVLIDFDQRPREAVDAPAV